MNKRKNVMGADFICSLSRIPACSPDDTDKLKAKFDEVGRETIVAELIETLRFDDEELTELSDAELLNMGIRAYKALYREPRDTTILHLEGKDYYLSGCQSYGDQTEGMEEIQLLTIYGFDTIQEEEGKENEQPIRMSF
jgi:hypothetical protein